jgi:hypothetical protein
MASDTVQFGASTSLVTETERAAWRGIRSIGGLAHA